MKILYRIGTVIFTVCVFLITGFLAIMIPANSRAFYKAQFSSEDYFGDTVLNVVKEQAENIEDEKAKEYVENMTEEQLLDLMAHAMKYCLFLEKDLNITVDGEYLEIFRADEVSHMEDVKGVFGGGLIIVLVAIVLFGATLTFGLLNKRKYYEYARKFPYYALIGVVAVLGFIGIAAAIDFDKAFEVFHQIFFDGNWQFSSGVMISMIGPIFVDLVPIILGIWIGELALFVAFIYFFNKYLKKKFNPVQVDRL